MTELQSIGLAKEQLQNLHVDEHVPLAQVLTFDFENQKPDNYQRPDTNGIDTPDKLFAYLSGDSIETVTLSELDKIKDSLESHNMPSLYARALQAGREVRLSQDTSVSFVLYDDGTHDLVYHSPGNKHKSIDLSPSAWSAANQ
jgi:hypothetical protein